MGPTGGPDRPDVPARLLVADSDAAVRRLLRSHLEVAGYEVIDADDGVEALAVCRAGGVDTALIDLSLPLISGRDVVLLLQDGPAEDRLPVILMSDEGSPAAVVAGLALGAADFVTKPLEVEVVTARVGAALRAREGVGELRRRNSDLVTASQVDELTGLYNRAHLEARLASDASFARRHWVSASVMVVDIDHFKAINDRVGHAGGDDVLRAVAHQLQGGTRAEDACGRWGGDEFVVVLPATDRDSAAAAAEHLRASVAAAPVVIGPDRVEVTVSIGVASGAPLVPGALVDAADAALYRAKAAGRNAVAVAVADAVPDGGAARARRGPTLIRPLTPAPSGAAADDPRVRGALAVLAGEEAGAVAGRAGVESELVDRWVDLFVAGGTDRVLGRLPQDPRETRERFLALLGHELLTPVSVIKGWAELLSTPILDADRRRLGIASLNEAAERMRELAQDMLDSAAVSMGALRMHLGPVDMVAVVEEVTAEIQSRVEVRAAPAARMIGDGGRLRHVLRSILAQAEATGADRIEVVLSTSASHVTVTVTTIGRALDVRAAQLLFEPWAGLTGTTGSVFGLYACRALVVAHGGHIGVKGDERSTTFWIRLPVQGPVDGPASPEEVMS